MPNFYLIPFEVAATKPGLRRCGSRVKAVENYLEKFKRVGYLCRKGFSDFEIARTVGISTAATTTFVELYRSFKGQALFANRMEEIEIVGAQSYQARDEKKEFPTLKPSMSGEQVKP